MHEPPEESPSIPGRAVESQLAVDILVGRFQHIYKKRTIPQRDLPGRPRSFLGGDLCISIGSSVRSGLFFQTRRIIGIPVSMAGVGVFRSPLKISGLSPPGAGVYNSLVVRLEPGHGS